MTERRATRAFRAAALLVWTTMGCGPASEQLALQRERDELRHEIVEVRQYNADLKFRMQLVEARNKVLIDLVQGLSSDPEHFTPRREGGSNADASLKALDRDIEALVASVRLSRKDIDALRAQRASLESELAQARRSIEDARATHAEVDARLALLRRLLTPMLGLIQAGRINLSLANGHLTIQLLESALFVQGEARLTPEGRVLLAQVAQGLRTTTDRQYRLAGPAHLVSKHVPKQGPLSAARALRVLDYLVQCNVPSANLIAASHISVHVPAANTPATARYFEITLLPRAEEISALPSVQQLLEPKATPDPETTAPSNLPPSSPPAVTPPPPPAQIEPQAAAAPSPAP
jgi:flagellar motor protein MotB